MTKSSEDSAGTYALENIQTHHGITSGSRTEEKTIIATPLLTNQLLFSCDPLTLQQPKDNPYETQPAYNPFYKLPVDNVPYRRDDDVAYKQIIVESNITKKEEKNTERKGSETACRILCSTNYSITAIVTISIIVITIMIYFIIKYLNIVKSLYIITIEVSKFKGNNDDMTIFREIFNTTIIYHEVKKILNISEVLITSSLLPLNQRYDNDCYIDEDATPEILD